MSVTEGHLDGRATWVSALLTPRLSRSGAPVFRRDAGRPFGCQRGSQSRPSRSHFTSMTHGRAMLMEETRSSSCHSSPCEDKPPSAASGAGSTHRATFEVWGQEPRCGRLRRREAMFALSFATWYIGQPTTHQGSCSAFPLRSPRSTCQSLYPYFLRMSYSTSSSPHVSFSSSRVECMILASDSTRSAYCRCSCVPLSLRALAGSS